MEYFTYFVDRLDVHASLLHAIEITSVKSFIKPTFPVWGKYDDLGEDPEAEKNTVCFITLNCLKWANQINPQTFNILYIHSVDPLSNDQTLSSHPPFATANISGIPRRS